MTEQRRSFVRVAFDADSQVSQDDVIWPVELLDISLNGVLFKQPVDWRIHPGKPLFITIRLADRNKIRMEGRLVHITEHEAGCKCIHIDLDSITHLKRLIELNVGNDKFLERELWALIQDHQQN